MEELSIPLNYTKYYNGWSGDLLEFLELDNITSHDKLWAFSRPKPELEKLQREFALLCAQLAMKNCEIEEVKKFYSLTLLKHESGTLQDKDEEFLEIDRQASIAASRKTRSEGCISHWIAYWTVYLARAEQLPRAAYGSAYWVAYGGVDFDIFVDIIKNLLITGTGDENERIKYTGQ